ncbi:c-type cytochrome [Helicobacter sp. MIT 05-5293]|uniref:c-type cytochrome n=1 Tax=Helicobacter sp. MIT 05-5293 TaxID=1548149 RepID=UPI00051CE858|nr:c-type cytochrome [Helicobacter sp. MIT 05-5293]
MKKNLIIWSIVLGLVACSDSGESSRTTYSPLAEQEQEVVSLEQEVLEDIQVSDAILSSSTPAPVNNTPPQVDAQVLYKKCVACHGKDGKTVAPGSVGNVLIASLNKAQVIEALKGFRAQTLSKGGNSVIMYMQTKNLTDEDIEALATYIDAL